MRELSPAFSRHRGRSSAATADRLGVPPACSHQASHHCFAIVRFHVARRRLEQLSTMDCRMRQVHVPTSDRPHLRGARRLMARFHSDRAHLYHQPAPQSDLGVGCCGVQACVEWCETVLAFGGSVLRSDCSCLIKRGSAGGRCFCELRTPRQYRRCTRYVGHRHGMSVASRQAELAHNTALRARVR